VGQAEIVGNIDTAHGKNQDLGGSQAPIHFCKKVATLSRAFCRPNSRTWLSARSRLPAISFNNSLLEKPLASESS
jgi:hypothetical protein